MSRGPGETWEIWAVLLALVSCSMDMTLFQSSRLGISQCFETANPERREKVFLPKTSGCGKCLQADNMTVKRAVRGGSMGWAHRRVGVGCQEGFSSIACWRSAWGGMGASWL